MTPPPPDGFTVYLGAFAWRLSPDRPGAVDYLHFCNKCGWVDGPAARTGGAIWCRQCAGPVNLDISEL